MADLIYLAVVFSRISTDCLYTGCTGVAGFSMQIAKWLVIIFIILAIITFLL